MMTEHHDLRRSEAFTWGACNPAPRIPPGIDWLLSDRDMEIHQTSAGLKRSLVSAVGDTP